MMIAKVTTVATMTRQGRMALKVRVAGPLFSLKKRFSFPFLKSQERTTRMLSVLRIMAMTA